MLKLKYYKQHLQCKDSKNIATAKTKDMIGRLGQEMSPYITELKPLARESPIHQTLKGGRTII